MAVDLRDLKGCRILMAEDNEINMEIACEIIGSWGAVIHKVYNGRQAVDKFKEMPENYYDIDGYSDTGNERDGPHDRHDS